jgi:hypothetical protein
MNAQRPPAKSTKQNANVVIDPVMVCKGTDEVLTPNRGPASATTPAQAMSSNPQLFRKPSQLSGVKIPPLTT